MAALCGAATAVLPATYLRWRMLQAIRMADEPKDLVGTVYGGQVGKFVMTCMLFAVCIARFPNEFIAIMSTFCACILAYVIGGLFVNHDSIDG